MPCPKRTFAQLGSRIYTRQYLGLATSEMATTSPGALEAPHHCRSELPAARVDALGAAIHLSGARAAGVSSPRNWPTPSPTASG